MERLGRAVVALDAEQAAIERRDVAPLSCTADDRQRTSHLPVLRSHLCIEAEETDDDRVRRCRARLAYSADDVEVPKVTVPACMRAFSRGKHQEDQDHEVS